MAVKRLVLLRHGQAVDGFSCSDFDRALTDKGIVRSQLVHQYLNINSYQPDRILASPAARTTQTAEIIAGEKQELIHFDDELYNARLEALLDSIKNTPKSYSNLLVVGHNPSLELLVMFLSNASQQQYCLLQPSSLAMMSFECEWAELDRQSAVLDDLIHAKSLA